jgi:hypothetical protein
MADDTLKVEDVKSYTQREVAGITGVSGNTIQTWAKNDIVKPSLSRKTKKGSTNIRRQPMRLYSVHDVILIAILGALAPFSYNRPLIKAFSKFMHAISGNKITNKESLLDPAKLRSEKDTYIVKFSDKTWTWSEGLTADEKHGDTVLKAERPTVEEIVNDNKLIIWVNVSKIAKEIIKKL